MSDHDPTPSGEQQPKVGEQCECPARKALAQSYHWTGRVPDGSGELVEFLRWRDRRSAALSAPCSCEGLRDESSRLFAILEHRDRECDTFRAETKAAIAERGSLRAENETLRRQVDLYPVEVASANRASRRRLDAEKEKTEAAEDRAEQLAKRLETISEYAATTAAELATANQRAEKLAKVLESFTGRECVAVVRNPYDEDYAPCNCSACFTARRAKAALAEYRAGKEQG